MLRDWIWLSTRKGLGPIGVLRVLEQFGDPERAYYAPPELLREVPGITRQGVESLMDKSLDQTERILEDCQRLNLRVLTIQDGAYPNRLRQIADPPPLLYVLGRQIHFDQEAAIGVVGSRNPSVYGVSVAARLGLELARGGALLVSGLAQGIDTAALRGALQSGRPVVSVLAGGVDLPYPRSNIGLYRDVASVGAVISERPPGTPHLGEFFPIRNRIISGLSLGVVAVECARHSGTMKTMDHALEQGRDVFAVPGNIDAPGSVGPNWLIQQGAKPVTCVRDILEEYWDQFPQKLASAAPLTPEAVRQRLERVLRELQPEEESAQPRRTGQESPRTQPGAETEKAQARPRLSLSGQEGRFSREQLAVLWAMKEHGRPCLSDELVEWTQLPSRTVLAALTMLQVEGTVEQLPGGRFSPPAVLEP